MKVKKDLLKGTLLSAALVLFTSCMGLGLQVKETKPNDPIVSIEATPVELITDANFEQSDVANGFSFDSFSLDGLDGSRVALVIGSNFALVMTLS